jgi:transposase InsO family protein
MNFKRSVQMAYFPSKDSPLRERWVRVRRVAEMVGLSSKAKEKLEWIIFYHTFGKENAKSTSSYFGISRKTLYKWLKRFEEKNLRSLEEKSKAPVRRRTWEVTYKEEERIVSLRKAHIKWGKKKIKILYQKEYGESISTWKVERVIRKWNLFPDKEKHRKYLRIKAKRKEKLLIKDFVRQDSFGFLWHIDAIIIWWYGVRRVIFTAIEDTTKIAFARVYKTNSSNFSKDFLLRLMYLANSKVNYIHSDNGSEFEGSFSEACLDLKVTQIYSRPHTPKDNPSLERFNWTVQDEWLSLSEVGLDNIDDANKDLTNWLIEYNNVRPHETLDYQTPLSYAYQKFPEVLPMTPASTNLTHFQNLWYSSI